MDARTYVEAHASGFFADLKEWLAIPSISADPARRDEVRKSAGWLAARLRARIHAPNERAEMGLLLKGAEAAAYLWEELASAGLTSGAGPRP